MRCTALGDARVARCGPPRSAVRLSPFPAECLLARLPDAIVAVVAPLIRLYPSKYRDPVSGPWIKARYRASLDDIRARYIEWMIEGAPEVRETSGAVGFNPHPRWTDNALTAPAGRNVELLSADRDERLQLDALEVCLVATFLAAFHFTWLDARGGVSRPGRCRRQARSTDSSEEYGSPAGSGRVSGAR